MIVVIDTSSLLSLVRYYLPFDKNNKLFEFIQNQIETGKIIVIDEVLNESKYIAKKIIPETLEYLKDKAFLKEFKLPHKTADLLPPKPKNFYHYVDNDFTTPSARILNEAEFEERKKAFLDSADARMIIYVLNKMKEVEDLEIAIVTEESAGANDHKAFKKIPSICKTLGIEVMTLPELLELYEGVNLEFN